MLDRVPHQGRLVGQSVQVTRFSGVGFLHVKAAEWEGYGMVPSNLKVLAKFGLCSKFSQKLDERSLARARKIFATARILGCSLKFPAV